MNDEQEQRSGEPEVDEHYIEEWVAFGLREADTYLTKQARFWAWCKRHGREEEPNESSS